MEAGPRLAACHCECKVKRRMLCYFGPRTVILRGNVIIDKESFCDAVNLMVTKNILNKHGLAMFFILENIALYDFDSLK